MTGAQLNPLLCGYSRSLMAFMYNPIKRYYGHGSKGRSYGRLMEERAPSVAQEFERVAAEKLESSESAGKATFGNSKVDESVSAKGSCKQHQPAADFQRRGANN